MAMLKMDDKLKEKIERINLFLMMLAGKVEKRSESNIECARITSTKLKALKLPESGECRTKSPPKPVPDCKVKDLGQEYKPKSTKRQPTWAQLSHTRLAALSEYER